MNILHCVKICSHRGGVFLVVESDKSITLASVVGVNNGAVPLNVNLYYRPAFNKKIGQSWEFLAVIFKLRQGASITRFVGWMDGCLVGLSKKIKTAITQLFLKIGARKFVWK